MAVRAEVYNYLLFILFIMDLLLFRFVLIPIAAIFILWIRYRFTRNEIKRRKRLKELRFFIAIAFLLLLLYIVTG